MPNGRVHLHAVPAEGAVAGQYQDGFVRRRHLGSDANGTPIPIQPCGPALRLPPAAYTGIDWRAKLRISCPSTTIMVSRLMVSRTSLHKRSGWTGVASECSSGAERSILERCLAASWATQAVSRSGSNCRRLLLSTAARRAWRRRQCRGRRLDYDQWPFRPG